MIRCFADHGSEKMLFDVRMGPQALSHDGRIYVVYQANEHDLAAHPHIVTYDRASASWSAPVKLGECPAKYDHHFAPIVWMDDRAHLHVLFGCHITPGTHLVSRRPEAIEAWEEGPRIAPSISYPTIRRVSDNKLLLFYRALGHLGFWAYRLSSDGGYTWTEARRLLDFDQNPREHDDADTWAGEYTSVCAGADGRSLHIGFVYWDERRGRHPRYRIRKPSRARYNLYYLGLDVPTGRLYTATGEEVKAPINRRHADEVAKVWDTGLELSNMPSVAVGPRNEPYFLLPVSDQSPWRSRFYFVAQRKDGWQYTPITSTNNTWAGCLLQRHDADTLVAYLIVGSELDETLYYSGGRLERWISRDEGVTWEREQDLVPEEGLLYNNPKPIELADGRSLRDHVVIFGWKGPGSIEADDSPSRNRARAYLWGDGAWL